MEIKNKYCVVWNRNAAKAIEKIDNSIKKTGLLISFKKRAYLKILKVQARL
jgi:hypothetical protein